MDALQWYDYADDYANNYAHDHADNDTDDDSYDDPYDDPNGARAGFSISARFRFDWGDRVN